MGEFILIKASIIALFIVNINYFVNGSPTDNDKRIKLKPVQIQCDIAEIFCDQYNSCLSKKSEKDTCETIISRLKISCPDKTKFCVAKLICLPESQTCFEKAEKLSNDNLGDSDCQKNKKNCKTTEASRGKKTLTIEDKNDEKENDDSSSFEINPDFPGHIGNTSADSRVTTHVEIVPTSLINDVVEGKNITADTDDVIFINVKTNYHNNVTPREMVTFQNGRKIDKPSIGNPDYVLLHFVTVDTNDTPSVLVDNLPENSVSLKVTEIINQAGVGDWIIKNDNKEITLSNADKTTETVLSKSTLILLKNSKLSGIAQLVLSAKSDRQTWEINLVKIVLPKSLADEMNLTLQMNNLTFNIDEGVQWIKITDLFNLEFLDNFRDLKQDVDEVFDKIPDSNEKQVQQKTFQRKLSNLQSELGLCLSPISNPSIIGTINAENTENQTKTSISLNDGDTICVLKEKYRINFRFNAGSSGLQQIVARPWNGDYYSKDALQELHFTLEVYSQKTREANLPKLQNFANNLKFPDVPYNLTEGGMELGVNTILAQFYAQPITDSVLGMAVVSAGTGNYGGWQYFKNKVWSDFPVSLKRGWELFSANERTRLTGKFQTFNFTDFKEMSSIDALLLDGSVKIRFYPSNGKAFWSNNEAIKETVFAFLAWNPPNSLTSHGTVAQLDVPLCVKCTDTQISKDGIIFYSERYGCDNVLSSTKTYDDCNVCGGTNQCYDCQNVPYGKAKWACGICSEMGDSLKDCRGVCNGTAQVFSDGRCIDPSKDVKGCDGDYMSMAYINECGFCVGGLLNRSASYGKDQCNICNGTDTCLGCDNVPNSGKVFDLCKRCLNPAQKGFNQGCGIKYGSMSTNILNNQNQTVTLEVSGINENSDVACILIPHETGRKNFTLITSKPQPKEINKEVFVFAIFYNTGVPGEYSLLCTIDGFTVQFNETVFIYDYNSFQISSAFPSTLNLDDTPANRKVKLTGTFPMEVAKDAFCLDGKSFMPPNVYQVLSFTSTEVSCDLSRVDKSLLLNLRVIPRNEMLSQIIDKQKSIEVKVYARTPKLVSADFGSSLVDITIYFDTNVQGPDGCDKIFDGPLLSNFGAHPVCTFSANELRVSLGSNSLLNVNDKISLKANSVSQASATYPSYTLSSVSVQLEGPKQMSVPQITIDQLQRTSYCSDHITVSVKKITGDGGRQVVYNWQWQSLDNSSDASSKTLESLMKEFLVSQTDNQISIPKSIYASSNPLTFSLAVVGCNFLNYCSQPTQTQIAIDAVEETLKIDILGFEPPIRASQKLNLNAVTSLKYCNYMEQLRDGVKYLWEIVHNNTGENKVLPKYGNSFTIPKLTFKAGQIVQLLVHAAYINQDMIKNVTATHFKYITFEPEPLWIRLGALSRKLGVGQVLIIDASMSVDPNLKDNSTLQHTWTCLKLDQTNESNPLGAPCYVNNNGTTVLLEQLLQTNQPILSVPSKLLFPGMYNFTDTVHSESLQQRETVTVNYVVNNSVSIEMVPLTERKPNVDNALNLKWNVIASPNSTIQMDFIETEGFGKVEMPNAVKLKCKHVVPIKSQENSSYTFALTLPAKGSTFYSDWQGLQHGTFYKIKLTVNSSGNIGESEHVFQTNTPPSVGKFELLSNDTSRTALTTVVTLSATSGWIDDPLDLPLSYSFGVKAHYVDGTKKDLWYPASSNDQMEMQFASAVTAHPICDRIGYQVMVKVCDYYGSCVIKVTPDAPFQVLPPANLTASVEMVLKDIEYATSSGQLLLAYQKIHLLLAEMCDTVSNDVANSGLAVAFEIISNMNETLDQDEILNGLQQTNDLLMSPKILANDNLLKKFSGLIKSISRMLGMFPNKKVARKKRSVDDSSSNKGMDVGSALQLMAAYELILKHSTDSNTVIMYLEATEELMSELCKGRDSSMEPTMVQATSVPNPIGILKSLTIELESNIVIEPIDGPLLLNEYPFKLEISKQFQSKYQSWQCNKKKTTCSSVCLSMAQFNTGSNFQPFTSHFVTNSSKLLSKLYYLQLADPISGDSFALTTNDSYSVWLPTNVSSTNLYQCKIFMNSVWSDSVCNIINTTYNGSQVFVLCACTNLGYISVFEAPLPPLPGISAKQPANISFAINGMNLNKTYLQLLSTNVNVSVRRFVDGQFSGSGQKIVSFILKPPLAFDLQETNFIVFKLNQTLNYSSAKSNAFDSVPNSLSVLPIKRTLYGDNNPRNVTMTFLNNFETIFKNGSLSNEMITFLTNEIATLLEIKSKRIAYLTFATVSSKTIMNFVITPPSTGAKEKTAEAAAFYLKDQIFYGDYVLIVDGYPNGASMDIDSEGFTITETDKLPSVQEPYDSTPTIVGSVIGTIFFIVIIIVIALVVVKQKGRIEKISPENSPPHSGNLTNSNRSSAQVNLLVRRVSVTEDPPHVVPNRRS